MPDPIWATVILKNYLPVEIRGLLSESPGHDVLLINEFGVLNGGERSLLAVLAILQQDWKFSALVPRDSSLENALESIGIKNHGLDFCDPSGARLSQQEKRERLHQQISAIRPSLIHCNSLAMSRLAGPVAVSLGVPSVGHIRDIVGLSRKAICDVNKVDRLIAVSNATREFHVAKGIEAERLVIVHNGICKEDFLRATSEGLSSENRNSEYSDPENQAREASADDPLALLFVGQLGARKGIDLLAEIFLELAEAFDSLQLWMIGERNSHKQEAVELVDRARSKLDSSPFADRVRWLGRRSDVGSWMKQATVLVHPARQEPFGRVLLEAASLGLPIVSTVVGGTPEIVCGRIGTSLLAASEDVAQMAEACRRLLSDDGLRRAYQAELECSAQGYSIQNAADGLARQYAAALSKLA